ncbi:hypothetical protein GGR50DRAFT_685628 [Xylaria sp. CBS 124048]|nr:hypothetical protein GGR50DRAFT_685628 [Xylaria sp. CBS 124048]
MASNPYFVLDPSSRPSSATPSASLGVPKSSNQLPKKKYKAGRKHKHVRRRSFALSPDEIAGDATSNDETAPVRFYAQEGRLSSTSIDSQALLDHRDNEYPRPRRPSALTTSYSVSQSNMGHLRYISPTRVDQVDNDTEATPLLPSPSRRDSESLRSYGLRDGRGHVKRETSRSPADSTRSANRSHPVPLTPGDNRHNVNYPPSMPGTPPLTASGQHDMDFGDAMMRDSLSLQSPHAKVMARGDLSSLRQPSFGPRALHVSGDVCFPQEGMSEVAEEELQQARTKESLRTRRRRRNKWPDLGILEEWSLFEKEDKSEVTRIKRITEPQLINGRLRPINHKGWFQIEEDVPYRFTYFNEELQSTIHSQTISELAQPDTSFRELFIPDPPLLSDSSDDEDDIIPGDASSTSRGAERTFKGSTRQPSVTTSISPETQSDLNSSSKQKPATSISPSRNRSDEFVPKRGQSPLSSAKPPSEGGKKERYGERPIWWLDVLRPTEAEMKVLAKAFGIHPLTAEDIMLQEQREKVEIFRHYYFVNYRSFDQDADSENHLDPVNMYVVVFREGVLSFHFGQTPHPANVRRRIRQLKDFMMLSSDWISYAIIDDITDVYLPLIQKIEDEVDDIDDKILELHSSTDPGLSSMKQRKFSTHEKAMTSEGKMEASGDMLRRVGDCRKKVMILYRLLGNKADVIKGFAKRCNEHWEVAPRSEIGLYLGDIQDHIVTMTANLSHYEKILARCHANYIAQINICMNERAEKTAYVLGKLSVLGTIVLPMNIITGLWGMNVYVPGQNADDLTWFFGITGGLILFGVACFLIAKRVYNIV